MQSQCTQERDPLTVFGIKGQIKMDHQINLKKQLLHNMTGTARLSKVMNPNSVSLIIYERGQLIPTALLCNPSCTSNY